MKELTSKEEVESALGLSERFFVLFFKEDESKESLKLQNILEILEQERNDPYLFFFRIHVKRAVQAVNHLEALTKNMQISPGCIAFYHYKHCFTLSHEYEFTKELLESLIPYIYP